VKSLPPGLLAVWLIVAGCQATTALPQPNVRLDDEGAVYLYLQPLPREAERLRVVVDGISAVQADGTERPLALALRELKSPDVRRQRLLAAGPLPVGQYTGFVFRTGRASLEGEQGPSALHVPEAASRIEFALPVRRGEVQVVALALRYAQSVDGGFRFTPAFSVYRPERPAVGFMAFVANSRSNDVTVFNKNARQVFEVIATGQGPTGLALDQRARRLYVALSGEDAIQVVDVLAGRLADRIRLTSGDEPVHLALTPDGRTVLSANRGSNTVSVVDVASRFETTKIPVGNGPRFIALDRTGRRAFVVNTLSNTVTVIDVVGRAPIRTISTDPSPLQGDFNRRGDRFYVTHEMVSYVTAIDVNALGVARRFPVRSPMETIEVDPSTDFVYLAGRGEFGVGVHDPFSFGPVDFIQAPPEIADMTTDPDENALYLVSRAANRILMFDRIRKRLVGEVDVGDGPSSIVVMGKI
jgi:YVTN family beta-propeller protein